MTRRESAEQYFLEGCNCTQAVLLAFRDLTGMSQTDCLRVGINLGGGVSRLREVCGAVSGAAVVLGMLYTSGEVLSGQEKAEQYARLQEIAAKFEEKNGSIVCRELLGVKQKHDAPQPEARTEAYYKKRPCRLLVGDAAEFIEEYIKEHPISDS